jgi:signal transduction histidine kinase
MALNRRTKFAKWVIFALLIATQLSAPPLYCQSASAELSRWKTSSHSSIDSIRAISLAEWSWLLLEVDRDSAMSLAQQALEISESGPYLGALDLACNVIGNCHRRQNKVDSALIFFNRSLRYRLDRKDSLAAVRMLINVGCLQNDAMRALDAKENFLSADLLISVDAHPKEKAIIQNGLGAAYRIVGDWKSSLWHLQQGLRIRESLGDSIEMSRSYQNIGNLFLDQGNKSQAQFFYHQSLLCLLGHGITTNHAKLYQNIGAMYLKSNQLDSADLWLQRGQIAFEQLDDSVGIAGISINLGLLSMAEGKYDVADMQFSIATETYHRYGMAIPEAEALNNSGLSRLQRRRFADAEAQLLRAWSAARIGGSVKLRIDLLANLAASAFGLGKHLEAMNYLHEKDILNDSIQRQLIQVSNLRAELDAAEFGKTILEKDAENIAEKETRRSIAFWAIIGGISLLVVVLVMIVLNLRGRNRALKAEGANAAISAKVDALLKEQEWRSTESLLQGVEIERKRFGQEIHDNVQTIISAIRLNLGGLEAKMQESDEKNHRNFAKAIELLDKAVTEIQRISRNLESGILRKFGLPAALSDLGDTIRDSTGLEVEVYIFGFDVEKRLDFSLERLVLLMVHELVGNALKHAQAKSIEIHVTLNHISLNIVIIDDGEGFDPESPDFKSGIGLRSIRERVTRLHGDFSIDSGQGNGTTIMIDIPLAEDISPSPSTL